MSKVPYLNESWAQLDTLRLILAASVVAAHLVQIFVIPDIGAWRGAMAVFPIAARFAVLGFFVLSGFVIARSLSLKARGPAPELLLDFAARRIARIGPPLLFSMALTLALEGVLRAFGLADYGGLSAWPARHAFAYDFHAALIGLLSFGFAGELSGNANGPLWSLTYELRLYVLAALAFQLWRARLSLQGAVTALFLAVLLRWVLGTISLTAAICYASFALGMLTYGARNSIAAARLLPALGAAVALALPLIGWSDADLMDSAPFWAVAQAAFVGLFAGSVLWLVRGPRRLWLTPVEFSYSLYICHFPVILFCFFLFSAHARPSPVAALAGWALALAGTLGAALASGHLLERPRTVAAIAEPMKRFLARTSAAGRIQPRVNAARG